MELQPYEIQVLLKETANEKYLIFQTVSQTRRNVYQMQFNSMRILVVLGLSVSLSSKEWEMKRRKNDKH